jgi:hypothetical protein
MVVIFLKLKYENMKKIINISLLFVLGSLISCGDKNPFLERVYSIKMANNTPRNVTGFYQTNYPDTTIPINLPRLLGIKPFDYTVIDSKQKWEEVIAEIPGRKLSIFVLSSDTVNTYSWDVIRTQYKILKRYDLSLQDLQNSNWTITYP